MPTVWMQQQGRNSGYHLLMAAVGCSDERVEERDQLKVRLVETLIC